MKIRNGFVSNSSSSSFIIAVAKVIDINKLKSYITDNNIRLDYYFKIKSKYDLLIEKNYDIEIINNFLVLSSFNYNDVRLDLSEIRDLDNLVIYNFIGNEGDNSFYDKYDGLDYDINLSYFNSNEKKIYNMFNDENSGIDIISSRIEFGAGRNG